MSILVHRQLKKKSGDPSFPHHLVHQNKAANRLQTGLIRLNSFWALPPFVHIWSKVKVQRCKAVKAPLVLLCVARHPASCWLWLCCKTPFHLNQCAVRSSKSTLHRRSFVRFLTWYRLHSFYNIFLSSSFVALSSFLHSLLLDY